MCRHHHIFIVCTTCNIRQETQREFWNCKSSTTNWFNTGHCKIEQTSKVFQDRVCRRCELEQWEQDLFEKYGPATIEDQEAEAVFPKREQWGQFSHVGEAAEELGADNISLNF
ncbi:hypothetical protein MMC18_005975 [Xylographa bjoerkii]|nr:hypothetical protein [Xylographa bjoerkii]